MLWGRKSGNGYHNRCKQFQKFPGINQLTLPRENGQLWLLESERIRAVKGKNEKEEKEEKEEEDQDQDQEKEMEKEKQEQEKEKEKDKEGSCNLPSSCAQCKPNEPSWSPILSMGTFLEVSLDIFVFKRDTLKVEHQTRTHDHDHEDGGRTSSVASRSFVEFRKSP